MERTNKSNAIAVQKQSKHNYGMYRYFKGEKENPFEKLLNRAEVDKSHLPPPECMIEEYNIPDNEVEKLRNSRYFWCYEQMFDEEFEANGFSFEYWKERLIVGNSTEELKATFTQPDKQKLFKLWLFQLLNHVSDKYEIPFETVNNKYWNNIII